MNFLPGVNPLKEKYSLKKRQISLKFCDGVLTQFRSVFHNRWATKPFLVGRQTFLILIKIIITYTKFIKFILYEALSAIEATRSNQII